jgi:hypothetical protein
MPDMEYYIDFGLLTGLAEKVNGVGSFLAVTQSINLSTMFTRLHFPIFDSKNAKS